MCLTGLHYVAQNKNKMSRKYNSLQTIHCIRKIKAKCMKLFQTVFLWNVYLLFLDMNFFNKKRHVSVN